MIADKRIKSLAYEAAKEKARQMRQAWEREGCAEFGAKNGVVTFRKIYEGEKARIKKGGVM